MASQHTHDPKGSVRPLISSKMIPTNERPDTTQCVGCISAKELLSLLPSFFSCHHLPHLKVYTSVLVVIKCIYLQPTYQHFIQDIEDRCLLLMSSTSFVDLPFQDHRMMEKHNMDQNPYISSLCPKPGVVTNNMTRGDDVAQSLGPAEPKWGRLARVWCLFEICLQHVST
jgi:hypothetical protein